MKNLSLIYITIFYLFPILANNNLKEQILFFDKSVTSLNKIVNQKETKTLNDIAKLTALQNKLGIFITNKINFRTSYDSQGTTRISLEELESNRFIYEYNSKIPMYDWIKIQSLLELFQHLKISNKLADKEKFEKKDLERLAQSIIGIRHALFQYLSLPIANYKKDFEFLKNFSRNTSLLLSKPDQHSLDQAWEEINKNIKELIWLYNITKNVKINTKVVNFFYFWVFSIKTIAKNPKIVKLSNEDQLDLYNLYSINNNKAYIESDNNYYHLKRFTINNSLSYGSFYNCYKPREKPLDRNLYKEIENNINKTNNALDLLIFDMASKKYNLIKEIKLG